MWCPSDRQRLKSSRLVCRRVLFLPLVITGLVPVIPMDLKHEPHRIGMAGTSPAMTWEVSALSFWGAEGEPGIHNR